MFPSGAHPSRIRQSFDQIRKARATWVWLIAIIAVQAVVYLVGGPYQEPAVHWFGVLGLSRVGLLGGHFWSIATYWLFHGDWLHTGLNAMLVLLLGARIEFLAGPGAMSKTLVAGILGGGAMHVLLAPAAGNSTLLVGISGGCLGLLLLVTTLSPESRMMPLPVSGRSLGLGVLTAELLLALVDPGLGLPGFSHVGELLVKKGLAGWFTIGHACHFGGGMAGWAMGRWILRPRVSLQSLRADRKRRGAD